MCHNKLKRFIIILMIVRRKKKGPKSFDDYPEDDHSYDDGDGHLRTDGADGGAGTGGDAGGSIGGVGESVALNAGSSPAGLLPPKGSE
jgi:hypothetical protein